MREHFVVPPILSLTSLQPSSASKHPTSIMPNRKKPEPESDALKGWRQIANYLGLPISASPPLRESWDASQPAKARRVQVSPEDLNRWLNRPVIPSRSQLKTISRERSGSQPMLMESKRCVQHYAKGSSMNMSLLASFRRAHWVTVPCEIRQHFCCARSRYA
jgi:hypothetical protein